MSDQPKPEPASRFAMNADEVTIEPASTELTDSIRRWRADKAARLAAADGSNVVPLRPRDADQK